MLTAVALALQASNLIQNPGFELANGKAPAAYELKGAARWEYNGYRDEIATMGVSLDSREDSGSVAQMVHIDPKDGKWITFRFRGKAEDAFAVKQEQVFIQFDFYSKQGTNYVDTARRLVYREIEKDRHDLAVNGNNHKTGAAVWRTYDFEELLPFPEVDSVKITVGFAGGSGTDQTYSRFLVDDFGLTQASASATGKVDPATAVAAPNVAGSVDERSLVALGGHWYYKPAPGETIQGRKVVVTDDNADRLFYKDDHFVNLFKGNMAAWLRKGYLDANGNLVDQDRLVKDNVKITFDGSDYYYVTAHNIPNHPTAKFPDTYGTQGYNPSYIREQIHTYRLPLVPKRSANAAAMADEHNSNYALPMGAIGFAVNGVVFYNPFDAGMQDASGIMDRCCGHPSPDNRYHYHKYPICVNTPFVDKGDAHSPLIGFAFDGFPVYGPYESAGVMARDLTENKLNAFNAHYDSVRGWHYHVTPGKFPYIIGGYLGYVEPGVGR